MAPQRIHLVRHGEVENPNGLLYGRLPGFGLSERGRRMAGLVAEDLAAREVPVARVLSSPLQRARESAEPLARAFGTALEIDERLIEPWNAFEGQRMHGRFSALRNPMSWRRLINPARPSWGEPYREIRDRMRAAIVEGSGGVDGDVVFVTHQLPIWIVHLALSRRPLFHDPRRRRCALSSVTSFEYHPATAFTEVDYREPAITEAERAVDQGAA